MVRKRRVKHQGFEQDPALAVTAGGHPQRPAEVCWKLRPKTWRAAMAGTSAGDIKWYQRRRPGSMVMNWWWWMVIHVDLPWFTKHGFWMEWNRDEQGMTLGGNLPQPWNIVGNYFASSDPHHGIQFILSHIVSGKLSSILFGILFEILSGISSGILSVISSDILSGMSADTLSGISSDILSGISSDILSGILSVISSDILSRISISHSI